MKFDTSRLAAQFDAARAFHEARIQRALLEATHRGAQRLEAKLRGEMRGAGLGNLGNAIKATSDQSDGRGVKPLGGGGFSAWGLVGVRSKSARTRGAIEAYVGGADIRPRRGRWLWIPSDDVQRIAGGRGQRQRVTPGNWTALDMDRKVGPLVFLMSKGKPLLIVKQASVNLGRKRGSARALSKTGRARKGQTAVPMIVAFIGIPHTSRAARIDVAAIHREVMGELPALIAAALRSA
jgi:hypothetical protein